MASVVQVEPEQPPELVPATNTAEMTALVPVVSAEGGSKERWAGITACCCSSRCSCTTFFFAVVLFAGVLVSVSCGSLWLALIFTFFTCLCLVLPRVIDHPVALKFDVFSARGPTSTIVSVKAQHDGPEEEATPKETTCTGHCVHMHSQNSLRARLTVFAGAVILAILVKALVDISSVRYLGKVQYRDGSDVIDVVIPWSDAVQLTGAYKWTLLGADSDMLNNIVKGNTEAAREKWIRPWSDADRAASLVEFAELKQIKIDPWVWEKRDPREGSSDTTVAQYTDADDFFARRFRSGLAQHPLAVVAAYAEAGAADMISGIQDSDSFRDILHSPAESKVVAFETVEKSTEFWIKNEEFTLEKTGLPDFRSYTGHPMMIFRACTNSYLSVLQPIPTTTNPY